ncbi:MAG: aminopeptidase [Muribaculaceae bacterium]|nr:aminopeptidase [Muribaculaceae bacterium]
MKKIALLIAISMAYNVSQADDKVVVPDSTGFTFTDVKVVPTTPVKDQHKSGTCWCFAGTSLLEDEILRKTGKEINLSEMFTVRHCYSDKADRYVRMYGQTNFGPGGSIVDVPYVFETYGIVPEDAYPGNLYGEDGHVHGELNELLTQYVKTIVSKPNKRISTAWRRGFDGILDAYLGELPQTFTYEGKSYTPRSFADMLGLDMNDYVAITSFTHHPFYKPFVLEVSDNWLWATYQNVPLNELKEIVDNAIDNGYTVEWAADVSEGGFKWRQGYAVIPEETDESNLEGTELSRWVQLSDKDREEARFDIKGPVKEITVTPESRQEMFDRQETTDDHGMMIVGKAIDQEGNRYYKVKNSWNTNQLYNGYLYVSEPYFMAKTLSILVNKAAIPSQIANKLK